MNNYLNVVMNENRKLQSRIRCERRAGYMRGENKAPSVLCPIDHVRKFICENRDGFRFPRQNTGPFRTSWKDNDTGPEIVVSLLGVLFFQSVRCGRMYNPYGSRGSMKLKWIRWCEKENVFFMIGSLPILFSGGI